METRPLTPEDVLSLLPGYPLVQRCLTPYLEWLTKNVEPPWKNYEVLSIGGEHGRWRLDCLEDHLQRAKKLLRMADEEVFAGMFGFTRDLLVADPEKIHDVLAEPLFVLDLDANGFSDIEKLPNSVKAGGLPIPVADFAARRHGVRFAVEVKTIRTGSWTEEGKMMGDPTRPEWWCEMFLSNARTKIEDGNRHALAQLANTCRHYGTDVGVLVLYTRRHAPNTFMESDDYREALRTLRQEYPQLDYIACKNYSADVVLFEPELPEPATA